MRVVGSSDTPRADVLASWGGLSRAHVDRVARTSIDGAQACASRSRFSIGSLCSAHSLKAFRPAHLRHFHVASILLGFVPDVLPYTTKSLSMQSSLFRAALFSRSSSQHSGQSDRGPSSRPFAQNAGTARLVCLLARL